MQEERHEHRPINRGCGRHYGFDDKCTMCWVTKKDDDEAVEKWRKEQAEKNRSKEQGTESSGDNTNQG